MEVELKDSPHMYSFQQYVPDGQSSGTSHIVAVAHSVSNASKVPVQNWPRTPTLVPVVVDDVGDVDVSISEDDGSLTPLPTSSLQKSPTMKHFRSLKHTPSGQS